MMKTQLLLLFVGVATRLLADDLGAELAALREQTHTAVKNLAEANRTETALSPVLQDYSALLSRLPDKSEARARVMAAEASLYADTIGDTAKAMSLLHQLQRDFADTASGYEAVRMRAAIQARRDEAKKVSATKSSNYETGALKSCTLAADATLFGNALPQGTIVFFHRDGSLNYCFLSRPTRMGGHLLKGHIADWMTTFHPDGTLRACWLEVDEVIQGVPCKGTTRTAEMVAGKNHSAVEFHANGGLARAKLAKDYERGGTVFKKGAILQLDAAGNPIAPK